MVLTVAIPGMANFMMAKACRKRDFYGAMIHYA